MTQSSPGHNVGTVHHARTEEYAKQLAAANATGKCPFCDIDRNINPVDLALTENWRAWKCQPSYDFHARHIVVPALQHIKTVDLLTERQVHNLQTTVAGLMFKYGMRNAAFVMRSGNSARTGSTLQHIHAHIQEPNGLGPAFAVFAHATGSAQIAELDSWFTNRFMMREAQDPGYSVSRVEAPVTKHIVRVSEEESDFGTTHTYRSTIDMWTTSAEPLIELVGHWQQLIRESSWEGSNLFVQPTTGLNTIIKIIVPKGIGPVIAMIAPAINEDHARWQMGSFLAMAKKREAAAKEAAEAREAGMK